ncbi:MAG: 30S ribosomal protein S9 [Candidatus Diapherotrites archaeon]|nr:30S ribosomal protein S9 [Candidatus Diapherotrites archaeon]
MLKKKSKRKTGINVKAKRKEATARAVIRPGKGIVRVNKRALHLFEPLLVRQFVTEPITVAGDIAKQVNIYVKVEGGGSMSQASAARSAIAKALVAYSRDNKLRQAFLNYDRMLLVDDVRRVEPKKPLGTKARKKKQKSKR